MADDPQFPEGKIHPDDEGKISVAIGIDNGNVIINFGKPIAWLGLPPSACMEMGRTLIKRAREALEMEKVQAEKSTKH
jgi:hypothetical protein